MHPIEPTVNHPNVQDRGCLGAAMPVRIYDFPWRELPTMGELDYVYSWATWKDWVLPQEEQAQPLSHQASD